MERLLIKPRENWKSQVESLGFFNHTNKDKIFWNEHACYRFAQKEIEEIEKSSNEIESLCMELVDHVVRQGCYDKLKIPESAWSLIEASWRTKEKPLYGRMDFCYDGIHPPKLFEYNADTPLCLLETSVVQKQWLEQTGIGGYQMNNIHNRLVTGWSKLVNGQVHFTCRDKVPSLLESIHYLRETLSEAGVVSKLLFIDKVRWNGENYIDQEDEIIETLYKLTPWEWMLEEVFDRLLRSQTQVIEPAWKMILSNKGFLVLLWELFPGHPNLLPAYFEPTNMMSDYVRKPLLGRYGENVSLHTADYNVSVSGQYDKGDYVYQQVNLLPNFDGNFALIGSWIIDGRASGILIREDDTPITQSHSRIVPYFYN